jgi:hypothetical protein
LTTRVKTKGGIDETAESRQSRAIEKKGFYFLKGNIKTIAEKHIHTTQCL